MHVVDLRLLVIPWATLFFLTCNKCIYVSCVGQCACAGLTCEYFPAQYQKYVMGILSILINTDSSENGININVNFTSFWQFESACNRLLNWICVVEVLYCNARTLRSLFKWNWLWRRLDVMQTSNIGFSTFVSHEIDFALADQKAHHHRMADICVYVTYGMCFSTA